MKLVTKGRFLMKEYIYAIRSIVLDGYIAELKMVSKMATIVYLG